MFYYKLYPSGLDLDQFRKILTDNNGTESLSDSKTDFVWVETNIEGMYDKTMYGIKCYCKTILNPVKRKITDKNDLYFNLKKPNYMAQQYSLSELQKNKPYIFKPVGREGSSGNDVKVLESDFEEYVEYLKKKHEKYVICEYINKVDLYNGKKYHIRAYLLIRAKTKTLPFKWNLFKKGKILTAKLPYVERDYENSLIHDTHTKSTDDDIFCDLDDPAFNNICEDVAKLVTDVKPYPESETAFEIFGLDFIKDAGGKIWLLEVNDKIGYNSVLNVKKEVKVFTEKYSNFSKEFFSWVWKEGMRDLFRARELIIN